jgi:RimJ/RimL family protein N-acetyltransferase
MASAGSNGPLGVVVRSLEERDAAAATAILCEIDDARVLSIEGWLHRERTHPERARLLQLAAEVDGEVVAVGAAALNISTSAEGASWASVNVTAAHRRRGVGSTVLERLLDHLREVGGTKPTSFTRLSDDGERFALTRGWKRVLSGPLIALDPRRVDPGATPEGFRCVSMAELDQPRDIFEATTIAALDEPSPTIYDDIRYEEWLNEWEDPDLDLAASAAVLEGDRVVAFTYMRVSGARAQHGFTGTLPDYRGRGLATAAKRRALRAAADKGVTRVTTSNAEENAAMRAINRNLGFEEIGAHVIYSRDL